MWYLGILGVLGILKGYLGYVGYCGYLMWYLGYLIPLRSVGKFESCPARVRLRAAKKFCSFATPGDWWAKCAYRPGRVRDRHASFNRSFCSESDSFFSRELASPLRLRSGLEKPPKTRSPPKAKIGLRSSALPKANAASCSEANCRITPDFGVSTVTGRSLFKTPFKALKGLCAQTEHGLCMSSAIDLGRRSHFNSGARPLGEGEALVCFAPRL